MCRRWSSSRFCGLFQYLLNKWSLERDADPERGTEPSYDRWRIKFENLSGPGILIYVILLTAGAIVWIKSLDVTWYSSIWGLQFLVGQGYAVLALGILTVILLSRYEPMKTMLRKTEQHDLGKLAFAFVMLNIYLCFAEFLIIWSGNVPDEIPWYLNRIHGGWWVICSADFICHWLIPFCLLLSRDLKRNKEKMIWLTCFMIFARCLDMFWLIEPNFADAAGNLHIAGNIGILAYITVPVAVLSLWAWFYLGELKRVRLIASTILTWKRCWSPNMPTNDHDLNQPPTHDPHVRDDEHPGYEITDVNANGIVVFLAGLFGSVCVFFLLVLWPGDPDQWRDQERGRRRRRSGTRLQVQRRTASVRTWRAIRRCSRRNCSR